MLMLLFFFFFSTGLTVMYSFRLINFCLNNYLGFMILCLHEINFMLFPMSFLMVFSIFGGSLLMWLIFPFFNLIILNMYFKFLILLTCFFGMMMGIYMYKFFLLFYYNFKLIKFIYYFSLMWYMPIIFCYFLNFMFINLVNKYKLFLDLGWMEFLGGGFFLFKFNLIFMKFLNYFNFKNLFLLFLFLLIILIN